MAKELSEFPQTRGRAVGQYPYDEWFNGKIWQLENGEDFTAVKTANFRGSLLEVARKRGLKIRTAIVNDGKSLVIQKI